MALKRVLPSRLTGAPVPGQPEASGTADAPPAAPVAAAAAPARETPGQFAPPDGARLPPSSGAGPAVAAPELPSPAAEAAARAEFLQAAAAAFGPVTPAAQPASQPAPQAAPQPEAQPVAQSASEPAQSSAAPAPLASIPPMPSEMAPIDTPPAPQPQAEAPALNPAPFAPSRPADNPLKRKVEKRAPQAPAPSSAPASSPAPARPEPSSEPSAPPAPAPLPELRVAAAATPAATSAPQPLTAVLNQLPRLTIGPRDWSAPAPTQPQAVASAPTGLAGNVPVTSTRLDEVDQRLVASGLVAGPAPDALTSSMPAGLAEVEQDFASAAEPFPAPVATPPAAPKAQDMPAPALKPQAAPAIPPVPDFALSKPAAANPLAALPPSESNVPWASPTNRSEWEIEGPGFAQEGATAPAAPPPPADLFKNLGGNTTMSPASAGAAAIPGGWSPDRPLGPPELPGQRSLRGPAGQAGGGVGGLVMFAVIGVVVLGGVWWFTQRSPLDLTPVENSKTVPAPVAPGNPQLPAGLAGAEEGPAISGRTPGPLPAQQVPSNASIQFLDVPPSEANQPITGESAQLPPPPEDLSVLERFKQAVNEQRGLREGGAAQGAAPADTVNPTGNPTGNPAASDTAEALTPEKLQEQLTAYREMLANANAPAQMPKPGTFLRDPAAFMDGQNQLPSPAGAPAGAMPMDGNVALLPPPAPGTSGQPAGAREASPPAELYTNNPANLPVVGEPQANRTRVRQLTDFADAVFAPERPKVRVPQGLTPRLASQGAPNLEVLSFVPDRGVIAFARGKEGVLLIGESMDGWELVRVGPDVAEFKQGERSHYVTAQ